MSPSQPVGGCTTAKGGSRVTWDEAFEYVEQVIERECAVQGVTVRITDPDILATSIHLLRIGKRRHEAS